MGQPNTSLKPNLGFVGTRACDYLLDGSARTVDRSGNSRTLTAGSTFGDEASIVQGVGASLYTSISTLTNAAAYWQSGQLAAVSGECLLFAPSTTTADIISCTGNSASETAANNTAWCFGITSGEVQLFWETGAGTDVTVTATSSWFVRAARWHHLAFTRASDGRTCVFYLDGQNIGGGVGASAPTDASSAALWVGSRYSNTRILSAQILAHVGVQVGATWSAAYVAWLARKRLGPGGP